MYIRLGYSFHDLVQFIETAQFFIMPTEDLNNLCYETLTTRNTVQVW